MTPESQERIIRDILRDKSRTMSGIMTEVGRRGYDRGGFPEEILRMAHFGLLNRDTDSGPHTWYSIARLAPRVY